MMTKEETKEELRKVEARVKEFAESVERVRALCAKFQREHEGHHHIAPNGFLYKY